MADTPQGPLLTIGELSRRTGLAPSALRYYEAEGLLAPTQRIGGQRRYEPRVLRRFEVIALAKQAGFSLAEVRQLLDGVEAGVPASQRWYDLARRKLPEVQQLISRAREMERLLDSGLHCRCLRLDRNVLYAGSDRCRARPAPFSSNRGPGMIQAGLLFDTLVWKDASGDLLPWLAGHWEHSADRRHWRFHLRPEIRWHDGVELGADDVAFTFDYLRHGPGSRLEVLQAQGLAGITSVEATDHRTVVIRLEEGSPSFEEQVAGRVLILPKHIWSAVEDPGAQRGPASVLGSGPYRLTSFDHTTGACSYEANPHYFLGQPFVRRIELLALDEPLAAFHRGEVDAVNAGGEDAGFNAAFGAVRHRTFATLAARGEWSRTLYFNLSAGFPLDDARFRRAVAYALDREGLVRQILFGRGEPGSAGGLAPAHPLGAGDLPTYGHDPGRAAALLDELGLGGGAHRSRCPLRLTTSTPSAPVAELVAAQLGRVGLEVTVEALDLDDADAAARDGRYQLALIGHGGLGGDPDWLRIQMADGPRARTSVHGYRNRRFRQLARRQRQVADGPARRTMVEEMQRIVAHELPVLSLYVPTRVIAYDDQVFDAWYFTPGGVGGAYPGALNKHALVTGRREGLELRQACPVEPHSPRALVGEQSEPVVG